jgi:hypothetical protein
VRLLFSVLLVLTIAPQAGAQRSQKIAIWRLKPLGLDNATADRLEVLLRAETSRLKGFALQEKAKTEAILSKPRNAKLRKCGGETSCLCDIGKALRAGRLVTGVIGALGDDYTFDLKLVNISRCREERRINEALSGREDLLIGAIRQALYKLVVPHEFVGSIAVEVPVAGAEILLDDKPVGKSPLASSISGLRPGNHKLQIRKQGFSDFEDTVQVRFQQTTRVKVDLVTSALTGVSYEKETKKKPPPPKPPPKIVIRHKQDNTIKILAWSSLGLSAVGIAVGVLAGWRSNVAESELEDLARTDGLYPWTGQPIIDRGRRWATVSNIGWGVAGGAAALSLVLFLVDIFGEEESPTARVLPVVGSEGMGLVVQWPF